MFTVAHAHSAFTEDGGLKDAQLTERLRTEPVGFLHLAEMASFLTGPVRSPHEQERRARIIAALERGEGGVRGRPTSPAYKLPTIHTPPSAMESAEATCGTRAPRAAGTRCVRKKAARLAVRADIARVLPRAKPAR